MALPALLFAVADPGAGASAGPSPTRARDDAWILRIRQGDVAAFEQLFTSYVPALLRFAVSYVGDLDSAREVVDDVFLAIWEHRATWTPSEGAAAYMFAAVRHRALNALRAQRRREQRILVATEDPDRLSAIAPDSALDAESDAAVVDRMLAELPPQRRRIMTMRWRDEMTPDEIAAALGISRNAVYLSLQRSLETLRALFGPDVR